MKPPIKIFTIALSLSSFSIFLYLCLGNVEIKTRKIESNKLQVLWRNSFQSIKKNSSIKAQKNLNSIKKIKYYILDKNLHAFSKDLKSPIKLNSKGSYLLEVSFMSHYSEINQKQKIIIQYNLVEIKSKNIIWEISKTLDLSKN